MTDPSPRPRRPLFVAALVLVVGLVAASLAALSVRHASASQSKSSVATEALSAGRQIAVDFAAYDYRHLADDFKRVADESVGRFHQQFLTGSTGAQQDIVKVKAVSTAEVASAAVVKSDPGNATVVVALNRTVDNSTLDKPQHSSFGVQLALVKQRGRWVASDVKLL